MTCIVGLKDVFTNTIYMGADSCVSSGYVLTTTQAPKVFQLHNMLIGVSGSMRGLRVIRYALDLPAKPQDMPVEEYINTVFVDALREAMQQSGAGRKESEQEQHDNSVLIGIDGKLFQIDAWYGVTESQEDYTAIGSGREFALGSLFTTYRVHMIAKERVQLALEAASEHCDNVRGPYTILQLEQEEVFPTGRKKRIAV